MASVLPMRCLCAPCEPQAQTLWVCRVLPSALTSRLRAPMGRARSAEGLVVASHWGTKSHVPCAPVRRHAHHRFVTGLPGTVAVMTTDDTPSHAARPDQFAQIDQPVADEGATAPAVNPVRWSGKKTAVAAALALGLSSMGAVAAAAAHEPGTSTTQDGRGGFPGQGGPRGQMGPGGQLPQRGQQGQQGQQPNQQQPNQQQNQRVPGRSSQSSQSSQSSLPGTTTTT